MIEFKAYASGSGGNFYTASDGKTTVALECGIAFKEIQRHLNFKTSHLSGVMLTHEHADHSKCAKDIVKSGIDIYMSQGTIEALDMTGHRIHAIKPLQQFSVGTWTVLPFDVQHDAKEPLNFLLASGNKKLLYVTDTFYLKYRFNGLSIIAIECNHSYEILNQRVADGSLPEAQRKRLMQSHMSLENCIGFLKANDLSKVQQIILIHLSSGNSSAEEFKIAVMKETGIPTIIAGG